ncbi:HD-GYP domain-containing protein [Oleiphilus messinensis]|uniref:HD-GYP domain-containing protein n=1 Tax=Oleiphilus messinensis TaxID=141451 RepID=A0A1Y0ICJ5_9GAMM|nr:HD domain-containing phosphohydrolase [Oleiphilus messinensis]ARU57114.1 HD-GYP domain-containing protein [Oleiphilus messinensis]
MAVTHKQISVSQLQCGMYVSDLDRPWCQTPFPLQGFYVRSDDDIKAIASYCKSVTVDVSLDRSSFNYELLELDESGSNQKNKSLVQGAPSQVFVQERKNADNAQSLRIKNPIQYDVSSSLKKEVKVAKVLHTKVAEVLSGIAHKIREGKTFSIAETEQVAAEMADSVIRNPDAMVWLSRVHLRDTHSFNHGINASIWSLVFGRHLGLEKSLLTTLASGVLLSQVGKSRLPDHIINKAGQLDQTEFEEYKEYVNYGVEILEQTPGVSPQELNVVRCHRERHNGTGYPNALTGDQIPLLAKIAGLVDAYQELIEPRAGVDPMTPAQAVAQLYEARNIEFQEVLVEKFIQAVGVYPTGTVVELTTDEVGIVLSHNPKRRLWPKVMVVLDREKQPLKSTRVVDLLDYNEQERKSETVHIQGSLPYGAYDVDPANYSVTGGSSRWNLRSLIG